MSSAHSVETVTLSILTDPYCINSCFPLSLKCETVYTVPGFDQHWLIDKLAAHKKKEQHLLHPLLYEGHSILDSFLYDYCFL